MTKIIYVYGQTLPNNSANAGAVVKLCHHLSLAGHDVSIMCPAGSAPGPDILTHYACNSQVQFETYRPMKGFMGYISIALQSVWSYPKGTFITRMPQVAGVLLWLGRTCVFELHQHMNTFRNWRLWKWAFLSPWGVLKINSITQANVDKLDSFVRRKVTGLRVSPSASEDYGSSAQGALGGRKFDVGYLGSLMPGKGLELVIEVARLCSNRTFVVYGDLASASEDTRAAISNSENVTYGGYVIEAAKREALQSMKIGLAPYSNAGFAKTGSAIVSVESLSSLKVAEYLSARSVVIASNVGNISEIISDQISGCLCSPNDPKEWAQKIEFVLHDPERAARIAKSGRDLYERTFTYKERARSFEDLLVPDK